MKKLNSTLRTLSKLLIGFCVLCAVYCGAMVAVNLRFPQEEYNLQISETKKKIDTQKKENAQNAEALSQAEAKQQELQGKLTLLQVDKEEKTAVNLQLQADVDSINNIYDTILETRTQYGQKIRQLEEMIVNGETDIKICYLTFDDGPNHLTKDIVEKLATHDVYATFFTIGSNSADGQVANLRREAMAGHTIANHTFSHYFAGSLYRDINIFKEQVLKQDQKVFDATGFHTQLFRFPSGSVLCPFKEEAIEWLEENGFMWVDWNASGWDSGFKAMEASGEDISKNVLYTVRGLDIAVVLLHDFNYGTYKSLDIFIPQLKSEGYIFLPMLPESITLEEPLNAV